MSIKKVIPFLLISFYFSLLIVWESSSYVHPTHRSKHNKEYIVDIKLSFLSNPKIWGHYKSTQNSISIKSEDDKMRKFVIPKSELSIGLTIQKGKIIFFSTQVKGNSTKFKVVPLSVDIPTKQKLGHYEVNFLKERDLKILYSEQIKSILMEIPGQKLSKDYQLRFRPINKLKCFREKKSFTCKNRIIVKVI